VRRFAVHDGEVITDSISNPGAFYILFDRYVSDVTRFVTRNASPSHVEDLVIETFVTAFKLRAEYDPLRTSARPWIYGIANNLLRHHYRSLAREQALFRKSTYWFVSEWTITLDTSSIDNRVDASASEGLLVEALATLRPESREPLLLHVLADLTYVEVAEALEIPVGTVRSRISRAKEELRQLLLASRERNRLPEPSVYRERSDG